VPDIAMRHQLERAIALIDPTEQHKKEAGQCRPASGVCSLSWLNQPKIT
jgi:hypothetical protein